MIYTIAIGVFAIGSIALGTKTYLHIKKWRNENLQTNLKMNICAWDKNKEISLPKTLKKENKKYLTKEEYENQVRLLHQTELDSEVYKKIYTFLQNEFWNRQNIELEEKLFAIIGSYDFEESIWNESFSNKQLKRIKQYEKLKNFIESLSEEQINNNPYLKQASVFMVSSKKDIEYIIKIFEDNLFHNQEEQKSRIEIVLPFREEQICQIPLHKSLTSRISYYQPNTYKTSYIPVLDQEHIYVYEEYNEYARKVENLLSDIYFWQLTKEMFSYSEYVHFCYFQILHNCGQNEFVASFVLKSLKDKKMKTKNKSGNYDSEISAISLNRRKK